MIVIAGAALSVLLLASGGGSDSAGTPIDCPGTQAVGTSIGGSDAHADQISAKFALTAGPATTGNEIAYEYQTYGGKEYLEFNFGSKAFVPFHNGTSVFDAFEARIAEIKVSQSTMPPPISSLTSTTAIQRTSCK